MDSENYNEELRKVWRPNWLSSINELTSLRLQKNSWLDKNAPSAHWTFVEFMCSYFDNLGIDDNYKDPLKRKLLSSEEFEIIRPWHEALDKYKSPKNNDYAVNKILEDPSWLEIIEVGIKVKNELSKILSDEEKNILLEEIDHRKYC